MEMNKIFFFNSIGENSPSEGGYESHTVGRKLWVLKIKKKKKLSMALF
jgi:hypothetical protein